MILQWNKPLSLWLVTEKYWELKRWVCRYRCLSKKYCLKKSTNLLKSEHLQLLLYNQNGVRESKNQQYITKILLQPELVNLEQQLRMMRIKIHKLILITQAYSAVLLLIHREMDTWVEVNSSEAIKHRKIKSLRII